MVKKWIMVVLMGLVMYQGAFALNPGKAVTQYIIDSWNEEKGLPQSSVWTILQTSDGYLWIGTEEGLARFDGLKFTVFNEDNTNALTSNYICCLYEDSKKNLWIGTLGGGLLVYKNGNFKRFTEKEGLLHHIIYYIHEDPSDNIWIGTDEGGLYQWDEQANSFTVYKKGKGLADNVIRSISSDSNGNLWVGTPKGLCCLKDERFIHYPIKKASDPENISVNIIFEDSNKNLWIGTNRGIYQMREGKFILYKINNNPLTTIRRIFEDRDKNLWIATTGLGLVRYYNGKFSILTKKDGLSGDDILSITEDREGNLWVGTAYGGLNRLKDGKFTTVTSKEGLSDDVVFSVYEDRKGYLWFGTNKGLVRYKNGKFIYFTVKQGLTHHAVDTIYEDRQGFIWAGTDEGLNLLRHSKGSIFKINDYLRDQYIPAIIEDIKGDIWIGTFVGAKKIRDREIVQTITQKDGLSIDYINHIYEDSQGNLWFGTLRGGITRYKDGQFTVFTTKNGLAANTVHCIVEDAHHVLWIGTSNGLSRLKNGKFTSFFKKDGLFHNNIYKILEDKNQNLWMSTNKGIFCVSKKNLNDFAEGSSQHIKSVVYGKDDGMKSSECNGGYQSAGCKTKDGKLWFPTLKGAVFIDPENIGFNRVPPPVLIEKVLLDGVSTDLVQQVVVQPGVKRLEIHYTALSFVNPKEVKFKYKLEGYDDQWVEAGSRREAFYTNLDADTYSFRVTACNNDRLWNETGAAIQIKVIPSFWDTWWFRVMAIIGFAVLSYLVINFSRKYLTLTAFWKKQKYVGKFKLMDIIGSGGMGAVYKATNLMDKSETVAIKLLKEEMFTDESSRKRFKQEAAIIDQLEHPNIVKVIERGESRQNLFIAMEYLQGKTLTQKIELEEKLDIKEALHIMIQVADALAKIHSKNIIHRDLKPDNIMLIVKNGDSNFVKLLDFGLAKTQYQTRLTQTGIVIGTINYLSPEQISGKGSSAASDIYALGIIFYEMLTGEKPFFGETTIDIMKQIMDKVPIEPIRFREDIPGELNRLIMKMLDKEKKSRPIIYDVVSYLKTIDIHLKQ
ncbi:MAG: protein kinase [Candidatus Aminicenantes bacterium]|nr:MAG: protein kinase [Candidatus Aminicenantes bacterium]